MAGPHLPGQYRPQLLDRNTPISDVTIYTQVGANGEPTDNHIVCRNEDLDAHVNSANVTGRDWSQPSYTAPRFSASSARSTAFQEVMDDVRLERALRMELGYRQKGPVELCFARECRAAVCKAELRRQEQMAHSAQGHNEPAIERMISGPNPPASREQHNATLTPQATSMLPTINTSAGQANTPISISSDEDDTPTAVCAHPKSPLAIPSQVQVNTPISMSSPPGSDGAISPKLTASKRDASNETLECKECLNIRDA